MIIKGVEKDAALAYGKRGNNNNLPCSCVDCNRDNNIGNKRQEKGQTDLREQLRALRARRQMPLSAA